MTSEELEYTRRVKCALVEAASILLELSKPIGDTPWLSKRLDEWSDLIRSDPMKPTIASPPPSFSRISFHAPAAPVGDEDFHALPCDDEARRMLSTMPPGPMEAAEYKSDRVAMEIIGGGR